MPGLRIVYAHAVEQDERFLEGGPADRQIGLHAVRSALLQVQRGIETKDVGQRLKKQWLRLWVEDDDGAVGACERKRI